MILFNRFFEKMNFTQRRSVLTVLFLYFLGAILIVPLELMASVSANILYIAGGLGTAIIFGSAWILYYKHNWETIRYFAALASSVLIALFLPEPFVSEYAPMVIVIPIILALILTEPFYVVINGLLTIGILLVRAQGSGVYAQPMTLISYMMIMGGLLVRSLIADTSLRQTKEAQEKTELSETRFRRLMENSSDQVSVLDATGRLLYESPVSNPILGYRFEEHLGKTIFELIHPSDQERVRSILAKLLLDPNLHPCERFRLLHSDDEFRRRAGSRLDGDTLGIDYAANARSLGAAAWRVATARDLRAALVAARAEPRTCLVHVPVEPRAVPSWAWWDVPSAELSSVPSVQEARRRYDQARREQRFYY